MKKITYFLLPLLIITSSSLAQHQKDSDVHISINEEDVDLEIVIDDLGEAIEQAFQSLNGHITVRVDDGDIDVSIHDMDDWWDTFAEDVERAVEKAVDNMTIEIRDIDARDFKKGDSKINGTDLQDLVEDIEEEYDQEVDRIDRLQLRFEKRATMATLDVTFENGRRVKNIVRRIPDR